MHVLLALAATTATPVVQPAVAPPATEASAPAKAKAKATPDPMQAMGAMLKMFDKLFPAGPEPEPARLAAARQATMMMFPKGTYGQAMSGFLNQHRRPRPRHERGGLRRDVPGDGGEDEGQEAQEGESQEGPAEHRAAAADAGEEGAELRRQARRRARPLPAR